MDAIGQALGFGLGVLAIATASEQALWRSLPASVLPRPDHSGELPEGGDQPTLSTSADDQGPSTRATGPPASAPARGWLPSDGFLLGVGGVGILLILAVCRWGSQLSIDIGSCLVMIFFMTIKVLFAIAGFRSPTGRHSLDELFGNDGSRLAAATTLAFGVCVANWRGLRGLNEPMVAATTYLCLNIFSASGYRLKRVVQSSLAYSAAVTTFILMVVYGPRTSKSKAAVVSPSAPHVPSPWVVGMTNRLGWLPPTYLPGVILAQTLRFDCVQFFRDGGSVPSRTELRDVRAARAARAGPFAFLLPPQPLPFPRPHFHAGVIALATTASMACLLPILLRGKVDPATSFFLISSLSIPAVILGVGGTTLWRGTLRKWWEYREDLKRPQPTEKPIKSPNGDQQVLDEKETGTGAVKAPPERIDIASAA
ncbi:hypothetical protein JCM24511_03008 [Saitozyma sp. JCM 24511]|nr:hypothetical protein JCM24511_03008 [Saitozyma sp. JCM 24511]